MVSDVITNNARNRTALLIGGSSIVHPQYFIIGTGSETVDVSDTTLVTASDRQEFTSTAYPSASGITWQGDWNAAEISGTQLTEWGVIPSGAELTGSIWSHHNTAAVTFDGTNELRIIETWSVT